ncbi:MAG: hypothetical protein KA015_01560 [Spirochaetes bacterium]|nr:hypothetical protein [Spirochaetota bacterium]
MKLLVGIVLISAVVFFGYKYRSHLMFWKSGFNKLAEIVSISERDTSAYERSGGIQSALQKAAKFREDDPLNPEAFIVSAKLSFIVSESLLPRRFGAMFVNSKKDALSPEAASGFIASIKYFRKAEALGGKKALDDESRIMLAKAAYYSDYYPENQIFLLVDSIKEPLMMRYTDDIYFYAQTLVVNGAVQRGIDYLVKMNMKDSFSKLVVAKSFTEGKQFTDAISVYKEIISETTDSEIKKTASINLGLLYFSQLLYREAAKILEPFVLPQSEDADLKAVMEKLFIELKDPVKAKLYALPEKK